MAERPQAEQHPRLILHNFLSPELCKELEFIHKSNCTVGYRPNVFSTTLSHLIATNSSHLIMPFVPIREKLKEKVEEYFGCQYELVIEFTGLISWTKGSSIGWHSDDNRPYLKQRDFAVVCYLNSYDEDFRGGIFHFQDGEPSSIVPMAGDVVMYTADTRNIHSVDEIMEGERITLTLWFSRDVSHDEDAKLISVLSQYSLDSYLPEPASNNMYWFPPDGALKLQSGFDIRCARLHMLGLDLYSSHRRIFSPGVNSSYNLLELLMRSLQLAWEDELFDQEFVNIQHVLQVVQFYCWKWSTLETMDRSEVSSHIKSLSQAQQEDITCLKLVVLQDLPVAETFIKSLNCANKLQYIFNCASFSAAVVEWETYSSRLHKELIVTLPLWRKHESIFPCPSDDFAETM
ncbi:hypothetical protein ACH5RR_029737 [Cinchona calisaya]|uniref:procollagen-proline 3-dioxygenase n=1 Tax=Cinchona calisaya TaxID=153742 RepID=A0ABD2YSH5_9GENT